MKTIYKYNIELHSTFSISMPKNAEIISLKTQGNKPVVWAIVDTEDIKNIRTFIVIPTGGNIDDSLKDLQFIGTFQIEDTNGSEFVGHLFERTELLNK